jgi:hypothetical protein
LVNQCEDIRCLLLVTFSEASQISQSWFKDWTPSLVCFSMVNGHWDRAIYLFPGELLIILTHFSLLFIH